MKNKQTRLRILAGVVLDLIGAILIAQGMAAMDAWFAAGIGLLLAGSVLVFQGVLGMSKGDGVTPSQQPATSTEGWNPEPELLVPAPRPVALTPAGRFSASLWAVMVIVVLGYLFMAPPRPGTMPPLLENEGVETTATVHRKTERNSASGDTVYYVSYHFATEAGDQIRASRSVPRAIYDALAEGDTVDVIYFPYDPQQHFAPNLEQKIVPPAVRWIAVAVLGMLLAVFEQQRRSQKRLVRHGKPLPGIVEGVRRRGGSRVFTVRYKLQGQERTLRGSERNPDRTEGDVLTVLYLPERPDRAALYSKSLYRARTA